MLEDASLGNGEPKQGGDALDFMKAPGVGAFSSLSLPSSAILRLTKETGGTHCHKMKNAIDSLVQGEGKEHTPGQEGKSSSFLFQGKQLSKKRPTQRGLILLCSCQSKRAGAFQNELPLQGTRLEVQARGGEEVSKLHKQLPDRSLKDSHFRAVSLQSLRQLLPGAVALERREPSFPLSHMFQVSCKERTCQACLLLEPSGPALRSASRLEQERAHLSHSQGAPGRAEARSGLAGSLE